MMSARRRPAVAAAALAMTLTVAGCTFDGVNSLPVPGAQGTDDGAYTISAVVPSAAGLVNNAPVHLDDSTVGSVGEMTVADDWNAKLTIRLNKGVRVPRGSHVMVAMTSVLGSSHLEIVQPDRPEGGYLKAGDQIPLTKCPEQSNIITDPSVPQVPDINVAQQVARCTFPSTEQVLSSLSVVLNGGGLSQLGDIVHEMSDMLGDRGDALSKLIPRLDTLVGELNGQRDNIIAATEGLDRLASAVNDQLPTLRTALTDSPQILKLLTDQRKNFTDTLGSMATLSETANKVLKANSDDIKTIVANLEPAIDQLQQTGPALTQSLNILLTFPFYEPTIPTIIKGDYVNSDLVLDLTPSRLNKSMFATARFIGPEGVVGKPASGAKRGLNPFTAPLDNGAVPDSRSSTGKSGARKSTERPAAQKPGTQKSGTHKPTPRKTATTTPQGGDR
ncbi:MAG: MCE family protein [Gordonia amarae]